MLIAIKNILRVTSFIWLLSSTVVQASVVADLFQGNVPIADQSAKTQQRALKQAFQQVLVKVSGSADLLTHERIKSATNRASQMVRAYQFEVQDGQLFYQAEFDKQEVQRLIQQAGFPIWGSRRPDTLLWVAVESPDTLERELINEVNLPANRNHLVQQANARGITIAFPVLDLTDLQQVSLFDVWGRFDQTVYEASLRYAPDYVLSARVYYAPETLPEDLTTSPEISFSEYEVYPTTSVNEPDVVPSEDDNPLSSEQSDPETSAPQVTMVWHADWSIIQGESIESRSQQFEALPQALSALTDSLADLLASRFAIDPSQSGTQKTRITLSDINSLGDYVVAQNTLNSLSAVIKSRLVMQSGDQAVFELSLIGDEDDLNNALRLEDKILPVLDEFGREVGNSQFRWVK